MAFNFNEDDVQLDDVDDVPNAFTGVDDAIPSRTNSGVVLGPDGKTHEIPSNADLDDEGNVQWTPTGRIKRRRGPRGAGPTARKSGSGNVNTTRLANDLVNPIAKVAVALSFTMPTVSAVLIERGEATANALVGIAGGHPKMLKALERATKVGPATDLVETGLMIGIAFALDTRRIQPEAPLAVITGVGALHRKVTGQPMDDGSPTTQGAVPVDLTPPPFTTSDPPGDIRDPRNPVYSFVANGGRVTPGRAPFA